MKCFDVRNQLDNNLDSYQQASCLSPELSAHLDSCELCQYRFSDLWLNHVLKQIDVPAPTKNFAENCISKAIIRHRRKQSLYPLVASSAAVLALFALGFSFFSLQPSTLLPQSTLQTPIAVVGEMLHSTRMAVNDIKLINVIIDSDRRRADTHITVNLADYVQLQGYENTRRLSWKTDLLPGKNVITLPVILRDAAGGTIDISYQSGADTGQYRVTVSDA